MVCGGLGHGDTSARLKLSLLGKRPKAVQVNASLHFDCNVGTFYIEKLTNITRFSYVETQIWTWMNYSGATIVRVIGLLPLSQFIRFIDGSLTLHSATTGSDALFLISCNHKKTKIPNTYMDNFILYLFQAVELMICYCVQGRQLLKS